MRNEEEEEEEELLAGSTSSEARRPLSPWCPLPRLDRSSVRRTNGRPPNDLESTPGLVRNTAFSVESTEYQRESTLHRATEDRYCFGPRRSAVQTENHKVQQPPPRAERSRGLRSRSRSHEVSRCTANRRLGSHARRTFENDATVRYASSCDGHASVVRFTSFDLRFTPEDAPDNTAFNDDDYQNNEDNDDDGNEDNGREKYRCGVNGRSSNHTELSPKGQTPRRRRSTLDARGRGRGRRLARAEVSMDTLDRRIVDTNACLDVPGGRLFAITRQARSRRNPSESSSSATESPLLFPRRSNSQAPFAGIGQDSRESCSSTDDREKWRKPRRRRRRKWRENARPDERRWNDDTNDDEDNRHMDEGEADKNGEADEDEDDTLDEVSEDATRPGLEKDYTARFHEPIGRLGRHRRRRGRRRTRRERTRLDEAIGGVPTISAPPIIDLRAPSSDGKRVKRTKNGHKRTYGLLLVLCLIVSPILCHVDKTLAPRPIALAQKSPLTHGDNFAGRNSSAQQKLRDVIIGGDDDGGNDKTKAHPYNEYSWEVNQINPWLSACDLAGPAPADLQGSCGPPEVPKNCPLRCPTRHHGDPNGPFGEVIKYLGVNGMRTEHRKGGGDAGGRSRRSTAADKSTNNKDDDRNKRTVETVRAPEQCLFYLEASHKRDICRDNFGRGSSLSFSNIRENRYWYISGLRMRHCCDHAVVNALAPGKGGPLEDVLNGGQRCSEALEKLLAVDALAARLHCEFEEVLARYDCGQSYSVIHNCTHCKEAYRKWVCSSLVPYFAHGGPPALETSSNIWSGTRLRPCRSYCQSVEQRCPYLLPGDRAPAYPTQYAGEPTFLCRDPNIPETGEQAMRALHGNEKEECCFHVCSEDQPGSGVCGNCTDLETLRSNRAGRDIPTAPQCEITSTSTIHSGSTDEKDNAESSSGAVGGGVSGADSPSAGPATSTTTSASFCGDGGVGSMPSSSSSSSSSSSTSSGQSTTQTPPTSPISLICLFWVWAALISLCTGQTVFPWSPPSYLFMRNYTPTTGTKTINTRRNEDYARKTRTSGEAERSSSSSASRKSDASPSPMSPTSSSSSSSSVSSLKSAPTPSPSSRPSSSPRSSSVTSSRSTARYSRSSSASSSASSRSLSKSSKRSSVLTPKCGRFVFLIVLTVTLRKMTNYCHRCGINFLLSLLATFTHNIAKCHLRICGKWWWWWWCWRLRFNKVDSLTKTVHGTCAKNTRESFRSCETNNESYHRLFIGSHDRHSAGQQRCVDHYHHHRHHHHHHHHHHHQHQHYAVRMRNVPRPSRGKRRKRRRRRRRRRRNRRRRRRRRRATQLTPPSILLIFIFESMRIYRHPSVSGAVTTRVPAGRKERTRLAIEHHYYYYYYYYLFFFTIIIIIIINTVALFDIVIIIITREKNGGGRRHPFVFCTDRSRDTFTAFLFFLPPTHTPLPRSRRAFLPHDCGKKK